MAESPETWIARPSDLILPGHAVPLLSTRIGGLPAYPQGCQAPGVELTACQACGKQLALLLQAHAPLSGGQLDAPQGGRILYLFGCTTEGCGKQPGCWRALRASESGATASSSAAAGVAQAQAAPTGAPAQPRQQQAGQAASAAAPAAAASWGIGVADDWGVAGGSDWGDGDDVPAPSPLASFDFKDLNAALEAVGSYKAAKAPPKPGAAQTAGGGRGAPVYAAGRPCLPAFYLHSELEPRGGGRQGQGMEAHLQQLVERYQQEEQAALGAAQAAPAAAAGAAGGEGGAEAWGGEGYEEDAVLAPAGGKRARVDAAFLKFSKQVARRPDQCARYSFGGRPLWPSSGDPPAPQPCGTCGGPRAFELQLMTPVMPALAESAEWLAAEGAAGAAALLQPADSWEWLTVCVNTCRASCGGGSGQVAVEEVVLASEE